MKGHNSSFLGQNTSISAFLVLAKTGPVVFDLNLQDHVIIKVFVCFVLKLDKRIRKSLDQKTEIILP